MLLNFQDSDSSLSYAGEMNNTVISKLIVEVDKWLIAKGETVKVKRKIVTSCIEILQNINKHSKDKTGFIVISDCADSYEAGIGSIVTESESKNISWEIEKIKFYTKSELYKKTNNKLLNMENGLGLLNVATLTDKSLNIDFKSFNTSDLFMVINFVVEKNS